MESQTTLQSQTQTKPTDLEVDETMAELNAMFNMTQKLDVLSHLEIIESHRDNNYRSKLPNDRVRLVMRKLIVHIKQEIRQTIKKMGQDK